MASSSSSKKITLKSSDDAKFELEEPIVSGSRTIKHMIEDGCADTAIPLPNVTGRILAKAIEYLKKHSEFVAEGKNKDYTGDESEVMKNWDANYVKEVESDQEMLFDLILAANYLYIKGLLDLLCKAVADMMRGRTPDEIRKIFHIKNDYTPEEEEEVRRENQWAFE